MPLHVETKNVSGLVKCGMELLNSNVVESTKSECESECSDFEFESLGCESESIGLESESESTDSV